MASIIKKKSKYSTYYVVAESARVDGKPRIVKQWYLGTIEKIIAMAEGNTDKEEPRQIDCASEGAIAALFKIAEELGIRKIIDQRCSKRQQGMSVGDYILIAALNRALAATSKSKIVEWVDSTALHLYMPLQKEKLESQNFWDHFDKLDKEMVNRIGDDIAQKAIELENIPLDTIVYDTSNYYNYLDVVTPSELSKITKSKAGRNSLRHIGLALAVDRDHGIPLFSRLYPANEHDAKVMKKLIDEIFEQINNAMSDKKGITIVFDKGNNSEELIAKLDESRHHFVGSRSPYHHKDLCRVSLEQYREVNIKNGETIPAYETREEIYGAQRKIIVSFNESTFQRQLHRMEQNLEKAKEELSTFKRKAKDADGRSTMDSMQRQALDITDRYHVTGLLDIDIEEEENRFKVSARKNFPAIEEAKTRFGKQILFTDRESLTAGEIIDIYLDRYIVEDAFRITKSGRWVKMDPVFHWTDSKIRVHALTCMIALLLVRIAHKRARANGFPHGAERMLELLSSVNTAILLYPKSTKAVRIRCSISKEQEVLLTALNCQIPRSM
ncbi:MAG: IS1634 family transposase [Smithella sp.]|jgi:transposase